MSLRSTVHNVLWGDEVVRVPTAVDLLIWICAITTPCFLIAAWAFQHHVILESCFVALAAIPILVTQLTCIYLIIRDPDRMQAVIFKLRPAAADNGSGQC